MFKCGLVLLAWAVPVLAAPGEIRHYTYRGADPAYWSASSSALTAATSTAPIYSTYIGDGNGYEVAAITTDASGNTYVAGGRSFYDSTGQWFDSATSDAFVTKLDAAGNLLFTATFSGKGIDKARAVAVDASGNIYLAGTTSSPNFPLWHALRSQSSTGFLVKLGPDGNRLIYSTYLWGYPASIAVDQDQNVYLTGDGGGPGFPHTEGMPERTGGNNFPIASEAFIMKISSGGDRVVYAGVISGWALNCSPCPSAGRYTRGVSIAVDGTGNAYVAGYTNTTNLPTTPNSFLGTGSGAFVAKVDAAGTGLSYLTYLSPTGISWQGSVDSTASGLAVDSVGNVVIVGGTFDSRFPVTPGAYQSTLPVAGTRTNSGFAAKLDGSGSNLLWATYLGGTNYDFANSVALDPEGNAWISGTSRSPDFPNANGWSQGDDFLVKLDSTGSALLYSARFPAGSIVPGLALDSSGTLHLAGSGGVVSTLVPEQPFSTAILGMVNAAGGALGGLVAPGEVVAIFGPHVGPATPVTASADESGLLPKSLGGVQVLFDSAAAPLLYVSDSQINAVVPFALNGLTSSTVRLSSGGIVAPGYRVVVVPTLPGVFRAEDGYAAALNEDGTLNSADNPARPGSIVAIWATGLGVVAAQDGEIATTARVYFLSLLWEGDDSVEVLYAGAAPSLVAGITQINFRVPEPSSGFLRLSIGGRADAVSIHVSQ